MLTIEKLTVGYDGGIVIHNFDLTVDPGTIQALVGRNGVGKTTLVSTIVGLIKPYSGHITIDGIDITGWPSHRVARAGVGLVPQSRGAFASLTVAEQLRLADGVRGKHLLSREYKKWTIPEILDIFPRLHERLHHRGCHLSGGERHILAIARALLTQPRFLLLDEPCEGLSPDLARHVRRLIGTVSQTGVTVLFVEHSPQHASEITDRITILQNGLN